MFVQPSYVTDRDNHRIQKFSSSGAYLTQWGSQGSGAGQFSYPYGIAVDGSGNVYVTRVGQRKVCYAHGYAET